MRTILLVLVALFIGCGAAWFAYTKMTPPPAPPVAAAPVNPFKVVVAQRDLPANSQINPDTDLALAEWPEDSASVSMIRSPKGQQPISLAGYRGWYVKETIPARMPVLLDKMSAVPLTNDTGPIDTAPPPNDPGMVKFTLTEGGDAVAVGAKTVDIILLRRLTTLGGGDWTIHKPIATNVALEISNDTDNVLATEFTAKLDPDLVKRIEIARTVGYITLVPSQVRPTETANRLCVGDKCFEMGKLQDHPAPPPPPSPDSANKDVADFGAKK